MNNLGRYFENPRCPNQELPKIGQRVRVLCIKEMIYKGNADNQESDWIYDGHGFHGILFWEEMKDDEAKNK